MSQIASVIRDLITRFKYWRWERRITKTLMKDRSKESGIALSRFLGADLGTLEKEPDTHE